MPNKNDLQLTAFTQGISENGRSNGSFELIEYPDLPLYKALEILKNMPMPPRNWDTGKYCPPTLGFGKFMVACVARGKYIAAPDNELLSFEEASQIIEDIYVSQKEIVYTQKDRHIQLKPVVDAIPTKSDFYRNLFIWVLPIIFFIWMLIFSTNFALDKSKDISLLKDNGIVTTGMVNEINAIDDNSILITYEYSDNNSMTFSQSIRLSREIYNSINVDDEIDIVYADGKPELSIILNEYDPEKLKREYMVVWASPFGTLIFLAYTVYRFIQKRFLNTYDNIIEMEQNGVFGKARIIKLGTEKVSMFPVSYLIYQFKGKYRIKQRVNRLLLNKIKLGDMVNIKYLRNDPEVSRKE